MEFYEDCMSKFKFSCERKMRATQQCYVKFASVSVIAGISRSCIFCEQNTLKVLPVISHVVVVSVIRFSCEMYNFSMIIDLGF